MGDAENEDFWNLLAEPHDHLDSAGKGAETDHEPSLRDVDERAHYNACLRLGIDPAHVERLQTALRTRCNIETPALQTSLRAIRRAVARASTDGGLSEAVRIFYGICDALTACCYAFPDQFLAPQIVSRALEPIIRMCDVAWSGTFAPLHTDAHTSALIAQLRDKMASQPMFRSMLSALPNEADAEALRAPVLLSLGEETHKRRRLSSSPSSSCRAAYASTTSMRMVVLPLPPVYPPDNHTQDFSSMAL